MTGQFGQIASLLREQLTTSISRSDVLKPLAWLVGMLLSAIILLAYLKAPDWLLIALAVPVFLSLALYGFAYVFCLFRDRDALRSERYSLQKMAIEQGLYGDDQSGQFKLDDVSPLALSSDGNKNIEEEK